MPYQYGQGFPKDLRSLVKMIKKENTIDFDPAFLEEEIKKILKYNKLKTLKVGEKFLNAGEKYVLQEQEPEFESDSGLYVEKEDEE